MTPEHAGIATCAGQARDLCSGREAGPTLARGTGPGRRQAALVPEATGIGPVLPLAGVSQPVRGPHLLARGGLHPTTSGGGCHQMLWRRRCAAR